MALILWFIVNVCIRHWARLVIPTNYLNSSKGKQLENVINGQFPCRINFVLSKKNEFYRLSYKEHLRISKITKFSCKIRKLNLATFANFVYICITRGDAYHFPANFGLNVVGLSARNTNTYKFWKLCKALFFIFYNLQPN